ncbi:MAG: hypothetical protein IIW40_04665 [Clostridia bacterium]|nr:hypothetical protein [Clostridia bacterium]
MSENSQKTLHIIPHTHWDREWYMGFERHRMRLVELFDTLIEVMEQNPEYTYYHMDGQFIVIQDYLEVRPQMRDRLVALIQADRIQIGPWYVLQDEFLTSGEANVRNMLYGLRFCRELGADPVMCGYFPDAFGNVSQAPQLLREFGIDNAVFGRGVNEVRFNNQVTGTSSPSEWRWQSPDGSEVLGIMFSHWYHNAMELPADEEHLRPKLEALVDACVESAATPQLLGMNGCDHQPVQIDLPEVIEKANDLLKERGVTVRHSNFKDYIAATRPYLDTFPVVCGELTSQLTSGYGSLVGTASTHVPLKQRNHRGQNLLTQQAEPLSVLAAGTGDSYRSDMLLLAWKKLMENHPHDSICCCSSDEVTDEMVSRFEHSRHIGEYVRDEALDHLRHHVTAAEKSLLVCHTQTGTSTKRLTAYVDYPKDKSVEGLSLIAPDGTEIPVEFRDLGEVFTFTLPKDSFRRPAYVHRYEITFTVTMSGIGYALYTVQEKAVESAAVTVYDRGAETAQLAFSVEKNGAITLTDKGTGITYTNLNLFEDVTDAGESYNFKWTGETPRTTADGTAKVWVEKQSGQSVTFGIETTLAIGDEATRKDTLITSYVTLTDGVRRLEIATVLDNQSENHRVRALFDPQIAADTVLADGQFDLVERPIYLHSNWKNPCNCHRCQDFFTLENEERGLAVATRGLHEYEILRDGRNTMALTMLRCIGRMGDWGIFPTPKMQCKGEHRLEYAIVPYAPSHRKEAFAVAHTFAADAFVVGLVEPQEGVLPATYTLAAVDHPALVTSACKQSEDGQYTVLRVYNPLCEDAYARLTLGAGVTAVYASNLAEEKGEPLTLTEGCVALTVPAKKIVTYLFG